ncbi:hypothetical protein H1R20_g13231, partial [Candolleomyces eurysporus]
MNWYYKKWVLCQIIGQCLDNQSSKHTKDKKRLESLEEERDADNEDEDGDSEKEEEAGGKDNQMEEENEESQHAVWDDDEDGEKDKAPVRKCKAA